MEAAVNSLFETSALLGVKGDNAGALENARLCVKEEKKLTKLRDEHGLRDAQNPELTFAVTLNLANRLAKTNGATEEALATYNDITSLGRKKKRRQRPRGGRVQVSETRRERPGELWECALPTERYVLHCEERC